MSNRLQKIYIPWKITCVLAIVVAVLSILPAPPILDMASFLKPVAQIVGISFDKTLHLLLFVCIVLPVTIVHPRGLPRLIPTVMIFGAMIEVVQPFFGRGMELQDLWANFFGVVIGVTIGFLVRGSLLISQRILRTI